MANVDPAVLDFVTSVDLVHRFVRGGPTDVVNIGGYQIPSIVKWYTDNQAEIIASALLGSRLALPDGSSVLGFQQLGTGTAPRTQQDKDRESFSVTDFYANGASGPRVDNSGVVGSAQGIQRAINALPAAGGLIELPRGVYNLDQPLSIRSGVILTGRGSQNTILNYTGVGAAVVSSTPGVRSFGAAFRGMRLNNPGGGGTIGFDLRDLSSGDFADLVTNGFPTAYSIVGGNGNCVYNRFYNVLAQNSVTGFKIGGAGSNSNTFLACRVNIASATGFDITDSNQNQITHCQIENALTGIKVTATSNALSDRNMIAFNRFEGCTTNYDITSTNVRGTVGFSNHMVNGGVNDAGDRSQLWELAGSSNVGLVAQSAIPANANGAFRFVRQVAGAPGQPAFVIRDAVNSNGTPTTLQIETERDGKFLSALRGGVERSYMDASGRIMVSGAAPAVAAGQLGLGGTVATTVGAAGGAAVLPATPLGYLIANIGGTPVKIPYYN